jgi:hypothetical protein
MLLSSVAVLNLVNLISYPKRPLGNRRSCKYHICKELERWGVVTPGIEPGSRASETLILSIVLRDQRQNHAVAGRLSKGGRNYELFQQTPQVRAEYFNGDRQQDHAKEFTDGDHPGRTQHAFDEIHGFQDDKNKEQV